MNKPAYSKKQLNRSKDEGAMMGSASMSAVENASRVFDPKQIVKRLGLARLRKMQALVRGFLVRRTIYPKELQDYLVAESALDLIISNVVYRQCSGMVVETVTLGRYDQDLVGEQRLIEEYLYNAVIKRVVEKQFEPIAKDAIYETAIYASRPNVTYGFNLRDPLQLVLYFKLNSIIAEYVAETAEEALREEALARRQLQIIDNVIGNMNILGQLYMEVIDECLLQGVGEYACESILAKVVKEGATVLAESVYNQIVGDEEDKLIDDIATQAE